MAIILATKENPLLGLIESSEIQILQGFPKFSGTKSDLTVVSEYYVPWEKVEDARQGFLGFNQFENGIFTQYKPFQLDFVGKNMFAENVDGEPVGAIELNKESLIANYPGGVVKLRVTFKPLNITFSANNDPKLFTERMDPVTTYVNFGKENVFWDSGALQKVESKFLPSFPLTRTKWELNYPSIPELEDNWDLLEGTTNKDTIERPDFNRTFLPGTLIVDNVSAVENISPEGEQQFSFLFSALFNKFGWNKVQKELGKDPVPLFDKTGSELQIYNPQFNFKDFLPGL